MRANWPTFENLKKATEAGAWGQRPGARKKESFATEIRENTEDENLGVQEHLSVISVFSVANICFPQ